MGGWCEGNITIKMANHFLVSHPLVHVHGDVCVCVPVLSVQCSHVTCCAVFRAALVLLSASVLF